ncbi:MAG: PDZ domain-containing protein [Akkermansia sp.]|nr:PDZ domain-containing protein [Akkermansia sp.]
MKKILTVLLMLLGGTLGGNQGKSSAEYECSLELLTDLYVGVELSVMSVDERMSCGSALPVGCAVKIVGVAPDSPAEKAGVMAGDVVVCFCMKNIYCREDFVEAMKAQTPGSSVNMGVYRDGKVVYFPITLGMRKKTSVIGEVTIHAPKVEEREKAAAHQRNIAKVLSSDMPDLDVLKTEFLAFAKTLGTRRKGGWIRIAYTVQGTMISVCCFPSYVEVMVDAVETEPVRYILRNKEDFLPVNVREMLWKCAQ